MADGLIALESNFVKIEMIFSFLDLAWTKDNDLCGSSVIGDLEDELVVLVILQPYFISEWKGSNYFN